MPRYIVERHFPEGVQIPTDEVGARFCRGIVANNLKSGVTWVHSYVTEDRRTTYCVYDGPSPDAIREAARANGLPADRITPVSVLDPYFYRG